METITNENDVQTMEESALIEEDDVKIYDDEKSGLNIFTIISDGKFHITVPKGTPGAIEREYETSDGKKGTKYELKKTKIVGKITKLGIFDGDFGKNILIALGKNGKNIISLSANSGFGESFLKKIPNVNIEEEVMFAPYSFTTEAGKEKRGMNLFQGEEKIKDAFSVFNEEKKEWEIAEGFPTPEGDTSKYDSDDWKVHFTKVRKYLIEDMKKNKLFTENFYSKEKKQEIDF